MAFLSSASKATKITLGTLTGLVVLVGIVPYMITWNEYKGLITEKAGAQLGREMQINGNVRFSLLPRPEAHLSDIVIKNPAGATTQNFLELKQLDVAVALFPLLSKNIEIEKITLVKPAITLEKMANGGNNWTFTPTNQEEKKDAAEAGADSSSSLKINDIALEEAYIRYVDTPAKSVQTVGPINANLSLESLKGPYTAKGDMAYNKLPVLFDLTVGAQNPETLAMPIKAELILGKKDMQMHFAGDVKTGDATELSGNLTAQSSDTASLLAALSADGKKSELPKGLNAFDLKSQILYSANKIALPGLQLKGDGLDVIADTVVTTGNRTNVTMDIGRLVVPAALIGGADAAGTPANNGVDNAEPLVKTMEKAFASAQGILNIAFPTTPLDVIVTADAISLPGKPSVRDMRLAASSDTSLFTLQSLQARLPGNTRVALSAKAPLNEAKKPTQLVATLNLSSDNPAQALSTQADTTNGKKDPIAVNATATLTSQFLKIDPLQITQQGQTLNGNIVYQPNVAVPLNIALRGGALNLDSFKGDKAASSDTAAQPANNANTASNSMLNRLKGFKAQFDVAIDRVTTGGKNFSSVIAKGLFSDNGLNLQQAGANLEGLALATNGTIGKLSPVGDLDLNVSGQTASLSQTLQALGNPQARNLGATNFGGTVKGDLNKIALNIDAKLDQGTGKIKGDVLGVDKGQPGFDGTVALNHPETATIVRNFAKMNPAGALGPFALNATIDYAGETIKADDFELKLGSAGGLKGSVDITPQGQQKNINANITSDKLNLAAIMGDDTSTPSKGGASGAAPAADAGWSRDPVNLDIIRNLNGKATVKISELLYKDFVIRNFNNDLAFANGAMKLNDLSADLFDAGRIVVNGTLNPAPQGQAHKGQFNLDVKDTDAAKFFNALDSKLFAEGSFSAQQQLNFSGASPYQIINSLNGDGTFKLRKAVVNGLDLDALAAKFDRPNSLEDFGGILQQASAGGTTSIGDVDVPISIRNGVATIAQTAVKTKLTETNFGGTADLAAKMVNMGGQIRFTEQKNMPPLGLKLTGPFNAPRKEFDKQSLQQFAIQKATGKYQDKALDKVNKLIGDKIPGGANSPLGSALGNMLGLPTTKAPAAATTTAPAATGTTTTAPAATSPAAAPVTNTAPAPVTPAPEAAAPKAATPPATTESVPAAVAPAATEAPAAESTAPAETAPAQ